MGKIIMTGVDGNLGGHAARAIMGKVALNDLIFTAPDKKALEQYAKQDIETRYADFNHPGKLKEAFADGDVLLLISMPFIGEKRRKKIGDVVQNFHFKKGDMLYSPCQGK